MKMKVKRNLSGIYFRCKEEDGSMGNRVFEDLPEEEQDKVLHSKSEEYYRSMIKQLSATINEIGNQLDLYVD